MKDVWVMTVPGKAEKTYDKHPTQKPISLLDRLILAATDEGDLVLDAFNGSGTTGVSCIRTDREYIGIEIDKEFIELSKKRFSEQTKLNDKLYA
jgi:site-specific DNA-methyltransferase (adenine-specific)